MTAPTLDPAPPRPRAQSLSCSACGAAIELHAQGWAVTVVCTSCGAVLDATDPNFRVLQQHAKSMRVVPRLALGTRGTWRGASWALIGFQLVTIEVEGTEYSWSEYVAFNPYRGFLYLSEYQGHWNIIEKLRRKPVESSSGSRPTVLLDGREFKHFQTATARTTVALGEFPWELRVGDAVVARDFIAPPLMLSAEASGDETTWSLGTYTPPAVIAKAFGPTSTLLEPIGTFANQPNPHDGLAGNVGKRLGVFFVLLALMLLANLTLSRGTEVFSQRYTFVHGNDDGAAFVTPTFAVGGRVSNMVVDIDTDLTNDWMFVDFTLVNETDGTSRDFSKQVSYYAGRDGDGNWSEGGRHERVRLSAVPPGRYFLRVAPEGGEPTSRGAGYTIRVRRDLPSFGFYLIALVGLVLPAGVVLLLRSAFEGRRWAESDYASATSEHSSDDDGGDE